MDKTKRYKLNEKRKKLYLTVGFLALMVVCGYMNTLELKRMQKVEQLLATAEPVQIAEVRTYYDTPLEEELQEFVIYTAEDYGLEPELVLAVIEKESNYNVIAIGDGGDSKGLMQIQEKWHRERMERLNVRDLFNPYGNIKVGIDILAELTEKYGEIGGLVAYNQGYYDGYATSYCEDVLKIKEKLNG